MARTISFEAAIPFLVGFLCIVGIGMTAATLTDAQAIGAPNDTVRGMGESAEVHNGSGGPDSNPANMSGVNTTGTSDSSSALSTCIEPLASTAGTLGVVVGFLALVGLVFKRTNFSTALLASWIILPPVMLGYFMMTNCGGGGIIKSGVQNSSGIPGGSSSLIEPVSTVPPSAMLGLVGLVLVAAVGLMYRSMSDEDVVTVEEDTEEEPELDQFAEAAGRAADRIEERTADVDNAVYRAWVEMTDLIDVENPEVYSAGEFASTAIELGMDEPDVTELTELFNEVRYGDRAADTREDRAVSVLRNIESQYGMDDEQSDVDQTDEE